MILAAAVAVVLALCVVLWFARGVSAVSCECPYDCPDHPTEGTAS